jgi:hypothetical protein
MVFVACRDITSPIDLLERLVGRNQHSLALVAVFVLGCKL